MPEDSGMAQTSKTLGNRNLHVTTLGILGVVFLVAGIGISTIHGTGLRGSGLGTLAIVIGVLLLVVSYLRYSGKIGQ